MRPVEQYHPRPKQDGQAILKKEHRDQWNQENAACPAKHQHQVIGGASQPLRVRMRYARRWPGNCRAFIHLLKPGFRRRAQQHVMAFLVKVNNANHLWQLPQTACYLSTRCFVKISRSASFPLFTFWYHMMSPGFAQVYQLLPDTDRLANIATLVVSLASNLFYV